MRWDFLSGGKAKHVNCEVVVPCSLYTCICLVKKKFKKIIKYLSCVVYTARTGTCVFLISQQVDLTIIPGNSFLFVCKVNICFGWCLGISL